MITPNLRRPSRRDLLALGAVLALPWGCAATLPSLRDVNLDAIGADQTLLLGRVRLTILDSDYTEDAFIRSTAADEEVLLPPGGDVAWVVRRPPGEDIRLDRVSSSYGRLAMGQGPVLAPYAVRTAITYFGTIQIKLRPGLNDNRVSGRVGQLDLQIVDDQTVAMTAFVAKNPKLAGRIYYHVLRGKILEAPELPG